MTDDLHFSKDLVEMIYQMWKRSPLFLMHKQMNKEMVELSGTSFGILCC